MSRHQTAAVLALVVAAGLAVQLVRDQPWADPAGSVLYAVAVGCALRLVWPGPLAPGPGRVSGAAFATCVLVELLQLTGLPAHLPQLRPLLGSGFAAHDLLWYAVGALLLLPLMARRGAPTSRDDVGAG